MNPADLLPQVYDELRKLAAAKLAMEKPGHSLDATALVHEAFLKLGGERSFATKSDYLKAAEVLGVSARTADTWWAFARAWLAVELRKA
jgi:hypothetical protein